MFTPSSLTLTRYLNYNAQTGRFSHAGGDPIDLSGRGGSFVVDFGSLEVGWDLYGDPSGRVLVPYVAGSFPDAPSPHHVPAVRVVVSGQPFGGARFLSGSTRVLVAALNDLHTAYEAAPEAAEGLIPVVQLVSTRPVPASGGTVQQPVFAILSWIARPAAFGSRISPAPAGASVAAVGPAAQPVEDQVERVLPQASGKPTAAAIMARLAERTAASAKARD